MKLEVRRRYIPLYTTRSQWEHFPIDRVVWSFDGYTTTVQRDEIPDGYASGLLTCYLDEERVDTNVFDGCLKQFALTREQIEKAIRPILS